jgi:hypothetical protein
MNIETRTALIAVTTLGAAVALAVAFWREVASGNDPRHGQRLASPEDVLL